jgi:uncharacterized SAM-binding protein YcdF (DUF218 family)
VRRHAVASETRHVIVIYGAAVRPGGVPSGTLRRRVEAALRFGATLEAPLYVPTGGVGDHPPAEAEVMTRLLRAAGVGENQILVEPTGRNTLRSTLACARLLRERGWGGAVVYAATSAYHLPRTVTLLRLAGLDARGSPPPPVPASARLLPRWRWRLREAAALPVDAAWMAALRLSGRV